MCILSGKIAGNNTDFFKAKNYLTKKETILPVSIYKYIPKDTKSKFSISSMKPIKTIIKNSPIILCNSVAESKAFLPVKNKK